MPSVVFASSKVKTLKSTLSLNGGADVISSTVDPTAVAVDASPGSLLLNTTTGKQYRKNDSGSSTNWTEVGAGTSGINYITNPSAATNTSGWATYADAAGAAPVDGTGGSPTVTWTRSTTTPLRGAADFNFTTPGGGSVQGQGVSTDFTIDLADQAKVLTVTFDYEVLSGTYASGDLTCYLIADPTGTPVVIQPAGYVVQAATVGTKMRQIATFQTQATGQSYRLCLHVASTSTAAYSLAVDSVSVGPQVVQYGSPVTDPVDYIPTYTGFGTVTQSNMGLRWWRSGANLHIQGDFTASGTSAAIASFSLPPGLTANLPAVSGNYQIVGKATNNSTVTPQAKDYNLIMTNGGSTVNFSICEIGNATNPLAPQNGNAIFPTATVVSVNMVVQVTGWSSTVQMSNDTDTRVVALRASGDPASAGAGGAIIFPTVGKDTHGCYSTSTGRYRVAVPGWYSIQGYVTSPTPGIGLNLTVDGSAVVAIGQTDPNGEATFSGLYELNAGQEFWISPTATLDCSGAWYGVFRVSGPSAIAASETVAAVYKTASGQSIPNSAFTIVDFTTKEIDTHGAVTTGASWKFTAPVSGTYCVSAHVLYNSGASATTSSYLIALYKGGSLIGEFGRVNGTGGTNFFGPTGSRNIYLLAGEFIDARTLQDSGGARTLYPFIEYNHISIHRIGN